MTGSANRWQRVIATVDSSGLLTASSCLDSTGNTSCPAAGSIQWTINASGVISESGSGGSPDAHYTMTANKNFIAGTVTEGSGQYDLRIAQKVVPETVYTNADVRNKTFVYHQLMISSVGTGNEWIYGAGTTDSTGLTTKTSETSPSGTSTPGATGITLSIDGNGVVTMSGGMTTFQGFLAADKKTIVGTWTDSGTGWTTYNLMIIQIAGQTYPAGPIHAGISAAHLLACGASPAPFWLHFTSTVAGGGVSTVSDWVSSNPAVIAPGPRTGSISSSGTVTVAESPSFHGQMSDDGKFMVATQTYTTGVYSLQVNTH
jgi:hypothetical protein